MSKYFLQDPADGLDWQQDWSDFLAEGDTIASRQWTIEPDGSPTHLANATEEAVTVSGLSAGVVYRLSEKITTAAGVVAERSITIRCEET